jgi:hypothetical protein
VQVRRLDGVVVVGLVMAATGLAPRVGDAGLARGDAAPP